MAETKIDIELFGFEELEKTLISMAEEIGPKDPLNILRKSARTAMIPVYKDAKANAPVDEAGKLPGGIIKNKIKLSSKIVKQKDVRGKYVLPGDTVIASVTVALTKENREVPLAQEFGGPRHKAQPYLRPALENNRDKIFETVKEVITNGISKYIKQ